MFGFKYPPIFSCVLQKSCVPGARRSAGTLSTAIEFMEKTSTSFKLTRSVATPQPGQADSLTAHCVLGFVVFFCFFAPRQKLLFYSPPGTNALSRWVRWVLLHVEEVRTSRVLQPAGHQGRPEEVQHAVGEHVSFTETPRESKLACETGRGCRLPGSNSNLVSVWSHMTSKLWK